LRHSLYSEMAALLNSDGTNYTVFLQCYTGSLPPGLTFEQKVCAVLGPACVVENVRDLERRSIEEILRESLSYRGEHAGPDAAILASQRFHELLDAIVTDCQHASGSSQVAQSFLIVDGHPAYPVFWDFALFFGRADEYALLVGAASD
jgi:hypothetical protein